MGSTASATGSAARGAPATAAATTSAAAASRVGTTATPPGCTRKVTFLTTTYAVPCGFEVAPEGSGTRSSAQAQYFQQTWWPAAHVRWFQQHAKGGYAPPSYPDTSGITVTINGATGRPAPLFLRPRTAANTIVSHPVAGIDEILVGQWAKDRQGRYVSLVVTTGRSMNAAMAHAVAASLSVH